MSNEKKAEKNAKQKEIYNRKKYEGTSLYVLFWAKCLYSHIGAHKKKVWPCTVFLFLHVLRPGGNVRNKKFDSGIWEPDDELLAAQEGTFEYLFLNMVPFEWILYEGWAWKLIILVM